MGVERFILVLILIFANLIGATLAVFKLSNILFVIEFLIVLFFLIISLVAIIGLRNNKPWVYTLLTAFFAFNIINYLFLFIILERTALLVVLMIVAVVGFLVSVASISAKRTEKPEIRTFEEYDREPAEQEPRVVVEDLKPAKKPRKKKAAKKKKSRKRPKKK